MDDIVRIGTVSAVDHATRRVRVVFKDKGMPSGWLHVLQHRAAGVAVQENKGDESPEPVGKHIHLSSVGTWMPVINETVVVLYLPIFNGDGFVLGGI